MKPARSTSVRVAAVALAVALLALAGVAHGESAATSKITVSPALAEAVANGEVSELPAFTATPVESQWKDTTTSGSTSGSATTSSAPSTITPVIVDPVTSSPSTSSGEVAVDTFKSKEGLSGSKSGGSNGLLIGVGVVGAIAAVAMAVVYKRRTAGASNDDDADDDDQSHNQQHPQPSQGRGMFESADYTPGKPSVDGMLQDDRLTTGSSTMLPVFSAADRMDMSGGIVRLSSPFGAKGARISSPAIRATRGTDNMEFSTGSQRGHMVTSGFDARSTAAPSSGQTVVHINQELAL